MTTTLVTGANGFIGSHLVEHLQAQGDTAYAMVRRSSNLKNFDGRTVDFRYADVQDVDAMAEAMRGVDIVYHVAGMTTGRTPADYDRVNGTGTANVFAAARKAKDGPKRVVYVSSLAAAGPSHPEVARREHHRPAPVSTYGRSKALGEVAAVEAAAWGGPFDVVVVRPPAVYGPRDEDFTQVIDLANRGIVLKLGFGDAWFSIVHAEDLVRGIRLAGERGEALPGDGLHALRDGGEAADHDEAAHPHGRGIYYVCDGGRYTWAELGQRSAKALGRSALTLAIPVPLAWLMAVGSEGVGRLRGDVPIFNRDKVREGSASGWWAQDDKARRDLGYESRFPLDEGLEQTARWLKDRGILR